MARVSKVKRIYEEGVLIAKECTKCHEIKSVNEFSRDKSKIDGLQSRCKQCEKKCNKQWHENNKEYMKEYHKQWHENNKEHRKEYKKQCYNNKALEAIQEIYEKVTKKLYPHNGIQYGII